MRDGGEDMVVRVRPEARSDCVRSLLHPMCMCSRVVVTTRPTVPGQVCDPSGVGDDDFDCGLKNSKLGYRLYRLKTPLKRETMRKFRLSTPRRLMNATSWLGMYGWKIWREVF
jgi:hypothetical protein